MGPLALTHLQDILKLMALRWYSIISTKMYTLLYIIDNAYWSKLTFDDCPYSNDLTWMTTKVVQPCQRIWSNHKAISLSYINYRIRHLGFPDDSKDLDSGPNNHSSTLRHVWYILLFLLPVNSTQKKTTWCILMPSHAKELSLMVAYRMIWNTHESNPVIF